MSQQTSSFWRRLDWRLWRHSYISDTPESERLAWIRPYVSSDVPPALGAPAEESQTPAQVKDISLGGIIFSSGRMFTSGTLLRVEVPCVSKPETLSLLARVIQVTPRPHGRWVLSCCFARELTEEDLHAFGAERVRPKTDDGRAWVRFPCEAVEISFFSVITAEQQKCKAKIRNISAGGVGLQTTLRFELGTLLSLELQVPGQVAPRAVMARVVHLDAQADGEWLAGCTFVTSLTDAELTALM